LNPGLIPVAPRDTSYGSRDDPTKQLNTYKPLGKPIRVNLFGLFGARIFSDALTLLTQRKYLPENSTDRWRGALERALPEEGSALLILDFAL
jgi:hypothetical protein